MNNPHSFSLRDTRWLIIYFPVYRDGGRLFKIGKLEKIKISVNDENVELWLVDV